MTIKQDYYYIFMYIIDSSKTPKPEETVGEYLRRLRESVNISQQDLAEAAGIHLQSLGKLVHRFN